MFVDVEVIEPADRRFDDVRGGRRPGRDSPPVGGSVVQESDLRLGAGKAPSALGMLPPCRRVASQIAKELSYVVVAQPFDAARQ